MVYICGVMVCACNVVYICGVMVWQVCSVLWSAEHRELVSGHGYSMNQLSLWKYPEMTKVKDLVGKLQVLLFSFSLSDYIVSVMFELDHPLEVAEHDQRKRPHW